MPRLMDDERIIERRWTVEAYGLRLEYLSRHAAAATYRFTRSLNLVRHPLDGPRSAAPFAGIPLNSWARLIAAGHEFGPQGCTQRCCTKGAKRVPKPKAPATYTCAACGHTGAL